MVNNHFPKMTLFFVPAILLRGFGKRGYHVTLDDSLRPLPASCQCQSAAQNNNQLTPQSNHTTHRMATPFLTSTKISRNGSTFRHWLYARSFPHSFIAVCCRFTTTGLGGLSELARQRAQIGNLDEQLQQQHRSRYLTDRQPRIDRSLIMAENWAAEINGEEDEDEALRIAIAMSLGQEPEQKKRARDGPGGVIDLTGDDDDGDGGGGLAKASAPEPENPAPSVSSSGLLAFGLDRKQMEAERLERLSKRKASQLDDQPATQDRPAQRARTSPSPPPAAKTTPSATTTKPRPTTTTSSSSSSATAIPSPPRVPFPHGVVKRTWAFGQPRQPDDIRLEDVLQKSRLELAVLSSFQWDEEWLLNKIDLARTKVVLVAFAVDEAQVSLFWHVLGGGLWEVVILMCLGGCRRRTCAPMCPVTGSGSVSRRCRLWGTCIRSCSCSSMRGI